MDIVSIFDDVRIPDATSSLVSQDKAQDMPWEPANLFPHASVLEFGALLLHVMLISISLTAYVSKFGLSRCRQCLPEHLENSTDHEKYKMYRIGI